MSRRDYGHVINYTATGTGGVGKYLLVKFGASDGTVTLATAATDAIIGASTDIASDENARCDVARSGCAPVIYGGNVTRGDWLTAGTGGKAVATTADGANVIGRAEVSGVANDIGSVFITPGKISTPA